jgi:tetratricopeptide (TPR) repeat protein
MHGPEPDYAGALKLLQNLPAASDRPTALTADGLRIECFQHLGASDKARHEIDASIKNQPMSSDVWAMLQETAARFYAVSKELRQQQDHRASDFAETALHIYSALASEASRNSARAEFLEALNLRIAEIHRDEKRPDAARALYEEQLARDASSADALYNLALIYEQQSDWAQAASCWRKLTRGLQAGTPRWFEARRQTVIALKQLGEQKQACDYATMTLVLHPDIADPETAQTFMRLRKELCGSQAVQ